MKNLFLLFIGSIFCLSVNAQSYYHSNYKWESEPKNYSPTEKEKKNDIVVVLQKRILEMAYEADGKAVMYETSHMIWHVNNPNAIERLNKGYVPMGNVLEEINLQARVVTSQNKVIPFNTSTVKKVDDYEDSGPYKIFAVDGVENGCDVEILYTNKRNFSYNSYYYAQGVSPIVHFEAHIISPENLIYEAKSYNGLPAFKKDTSVKEKNHIYVTDENVVAAENERYASEDANYRAYAYQMYYNTAKGRAKLYTWDIISREYYNALFIFTKDEEKAVAKFLSKNKLDKATSDIEKISGIDAFFKTGIELNNDYDSDLMTALAGRKMNNDNAARFYIAAFKKLQIQFELGLTTKRDDMRFDPKFPSYMYAKNYVFYFPSVDKYLSPLSIYSRLGFPMPEVLANEALFIKEVDVSGITSSSSKIKTIPTNDFKKSYHITEVKAALDFEKSSVNLDVVQSQAGYSAFYSQPIYRYLTPEQKEQFNKNFYLIPEMDVKNLVVENTEEDDLFVLPLIARYSVEQNELLENAGTKFVLKAGMLIGPQVELYSEKERLWPADVFQTHYLKRKIEINIPANYVVTNVNELNYEKICKQDEKEIAVFRSTAKQEGDKIIIEVYEDYQVIEFKLPVYEQFRAVINASADFNKKNLIFEKK